MNIISIDLPWEEKRKGRRAIAVARLDRHIEVCQAADDDELSRLARVSFEPGSIILLAIPIDGTDKLRGHHFRPVDRALSRQTLPALPASRAGNRGCRLRAALQTDNSGCQVYEMYPYAIYKFLSYLKQRKLLHCLNDNRFDTLLDNGFYRYWPPKYKREKKREQRVKNLRHVYSLLTDSNLSLRFTRPLPTPEASVNPDHLADGYDACLGAVVGIYLANRSGYTGFAGDSPSGSILLFADRWLAEQLGKDIAVNQVEQRS